MSREDAHIRCPLTEKLFSENERRSAGMKIFAKFAKATSTWIAALLLVINLPTAAMAEAVATSPSPSSPVVTQQPANTYSYNSETEHWDTNKWYYDAASGTYKPVIMPSQPTVAVQPTVITPQNGAQVSGESNSQLNNSTTNQTSADNTVKAQAQSGGAAVIQNTQAGNATSGSASSTATILNNVNSTLLAADNQKAASFVADVMGNVDGDIILQPMILKAMLEAGSNVSNSNSSVTANINNTNSLTNNIDLSAISGNAGVIGNTQAGNATSGTANTVANVVNIINSMIASDQSFVGTINIYGNLNGDILIAPNFISQLLASNAGSTLDKYSSNSGTVISSNDMQSIVNNVSLAAQSGKAAVVDNTEAGNATSGNANTNVVIFNLSGHEIIASNSLLVFVNVLGKWVGVIVDAPVGATAAAIGSDVKNNDSAVMPDLAIISNSNELITNNINLFSQSGDATVAANTLAGNAVSGNATASANIANITNSHFGLTGWFGVLFINVFGNWYGSFGINTPYGNTTINKEKMRAIEFIPASSNKQSSSLSIVSHNSGNGYSTSTSELRNSKVEGVMTVASSDSGGDADVAVLPVGNSTKGMNLPLLGGSLFLTLISAAGLRRAILDKDGWLMTRFSR